MDFDTDLIQNKGEIYSRKYRPILRFYDWISPTISIGYLQNPDDLNLTQCLNDSVAIVRRPTGGRAIYHWKEITYSIFIPSGYYPSNLSIMESYKLISECLVKGIRRLGIKAEIAPAIRGNLKNPSCFSSHARYEVVFDGKKLIGSAQRRLKDGSFLQQGSFLISNEYKNLENYVIDPIQLEGSISLLDILGYIPPFERIIDSLIIGFREHLQIEFKRLNII